MKSKGNGGLSRRLTRRQFVKGAAQAAAVAGFPTIVPASVFGQMAPSKQISVGAIGMGRISRVHDLPAILKVEGARVTAVCDLYQERLAAGKKFVNGFYSTRNGSPYDGITTYADYHELLANKDIDAVVISTPDHQHAIVAVAAVRGGKDVYLQKPASLTIAEGRYLSNAV
jgi:predicted dehydrogenase